MRLISILIFGLYVSKAYAQGNCRLMIDANIIGLEGKKIYLVQRTEGKEDTLAITDCKKDRFKFAIKWCTNGDFVYIKSSHSKSLVLFLDNSDSVYITGHYKNWPEFAVTGSVANSDYLRMKGKLNVFISNLNHLYKKRYELNKNNLVKELNVVRDSISKAKSLYFEAWRDVVKSNCNSKYSPVLVMSADFMDLNEKRFLFSQLSVDVQRSRFGAVLLRQVKRLEIMKYRKPSTYNIDGVLEGLMDNTPVHLLHINAKRHTDTVQTVLSRNGKFIFEGNFIDESGDFYYVMIDNKDKGILSLLVDKEPVFIEGDLRDWPDVKVYGSNSNFDFINYVQSTKVIKKKLDSIEMEYARIRLLVDSQLRNNINEFITNNRGSLYTPYLVMNSSYNVDRKELEYNRLTDFAKNGKYGLLLKEDIEVLKRKDSIRHSGTIPDFISMTPDGERIALYSVIRKSNLTIVDFWASWCAPCRLQTPELRKIYDEFHDKGLNIVSVSFDDNLKEWKNAIVSDQMNWYHVSDLKGRSAEAHKLYGIQGIPVVYLVDSSGNILGKNLRPNELKKRINEILGKF